jgi:hypothetical protein
MVGDAPAGLPDDTWVEVIGTYDEQTGVDPNQRGDDPVPPGRALAERAGSQ